MSRAQLETVNHVNVELCICSYYLYLSDTYFFKFLYVISISVCLNATGRGNISIAKAVTATFVGKKAA